MSIRRVSAAEAFATLKANPDSGWPERDDPSNRFAHFADPHFSPRFVLEPGQRIFTIGSCFARGIERALAQRGFEVPTLAFQVDAGEWGGDPAGVLNNYVPPSIPPQILWAFGMEKFDLDRHGVEIKRGRWVDLHLPMSFRPAPPEAVVARRERIGEIYRELARCNVVIVTLGLIEAWFDNRSGMYVNGAPLKSATWMDPDRFELHVLDYAEVMQSLRDVVGLLDKVCPSGYRMILTVSPVPLTATFTAADVSVANAYSKSVLRAAVEAFVAEHEHVEYFPSYESVVLTDRALAFAHDQIHVTGPMVRFNVDRMIRRYVRQDAAENVADLLKQTREDVRAGLASVALKKLQDAWTRHPDNAELCVALADAYMKGGEPAPAEKLLLGFVAAHESAPARNLLARLYNEAGRHEEAAAHAEKASELGKMRLAVSLQRVVAYYHLGRYEEALAVLNRIAYALERGPTVMFWKARLHEKLGRAEEAESFYKQCNDYAEDPAFKTGYAEFLGAQGRWDEAVQWIDRVLVDHPNDAAALRLRGEARRNGVRLRRAAVASIHGAPVRASRVGDALWWAGALGKRLARTLSPGAGARAPRGDD